MFPRTIPTWVKDIAFHFRLDYYYLLEEVYFETSLLLDIGNIVDMTHFDDSGYYAVYDAMQSNNFTANENHGLDLKSKKLCLKGRNVKR